jgi:flagellar basal-body rod protein FlgB
MKIFDSAFALSEKTLELRSQRMEILSKNIANADTPNYRAQDLDFSRVLSSAQADSGLKATHAGHINQAESFSGAELVYTVPFNSSVDGNTVEMSIEQAKYGRAAAEYQATLRFLEGEMSGIRKALRGD